MIHDVSHGDNYHREKRHVSPKASHLARDGADADVGLMAVVGWAVFKRASSILARNKDKERERERERGNGWISTKEGTRRNLIYASVRSSGCVLCEKTL